MIGCASYKYVSINGNALFTMVALPREQGQFPTVICRSPYVKAAVGRSEEELTLEFLHAHASYLERGYAMVLQHCRGCGKSSGGFVPYIHEREDGLLLREWIRKQPFYNGELFLMGSSYTASLHYATAPFEEDIRGAIFEVQDSERYRLWYRNGQMRKGHANWHFNLYKSITPKAKHFSMQSFSELPLAGLSERALGERAADFEEMLEAPSPKHPFWLTRNGGQETSDAVAKANIPILLTPGYNDFYVGGVFRMWERMDEQTKRQSALLVSPYNHGDGYDAASGLSFPLGKRTEQFGAHYRLDWLDHVRTGAPLPYETGVITYYRTFENRWDSDFSGKPTVPLRLRPGEETHSFRYDPSAPTAFSCEGCFADSTGAETDTVRLLTPPLDRNVFVKGRMQLTLTVASDRADTSFYARISIRKSDCTYVLRHDITSLSYQIGDYCPGEPVQIGLCFDEHAFLLRQGECLQIDLASTDDNTYVCHTNNLGDYHKQTAFRVATNTVYTADSYLMLPIECEEG